MNKYINKISKRTVLATQAGTVWILTEEDGTPIPFTPENDYFLHNYELIPNVIATIQEPEDGDRDESN